VSGGGLAGQSPIDASNASWQLIGRVGRLSAVICHAAPQGGYIGAQLLDYSAAQRDVVFNQNS
jgi:hypothetical protein